MEPFTEMKMVLIASQQTPFWNLYFQEYNLLLSHLLKASGFVLNLVRKDDQHTEILPDIRQLQNLTVHLRDEGQRKL